jgi:dipeptidyl aminopeptidase/acylaminoacyl peptidase
MILIKFIRFISVIVAVCVLVGFAQSQNTEIQEISEAIEKDGCVIIDKHRVKVCKFDYEYNGKNVEALIFRPVEEGKYPGVMLVPGYMGTPQGDIFEGKILARVGFAAITVGTPQFGKTELKPDFLGKNTINAYVKGLKKFKRESFVDSKKIGIFGYSRGAIAASLIIAKVNVQAAVLGGGIYDLKKAYDELTIEGIKENIKAEIGSTDKAFRERSVIYKIKKIKSPILIAHAGDDINAPTNQAYLLRDRLKESGKEFEFRIFADRDHRNIGGDFLSTAFDFLSRKLKGKPSTIKFK